MFYSSKTIIKERHNINIMVTCAVKYSYPTAKITWNIMTESSNVYNVVKENSTGNYILHNNGSLEVYHRFIYEEDHVTVMCLATNEHGSATTLFHIWDHERFYQGMHYNYVIDMCIFDFAVETFVLYVKACSCQDLKSVSSYNYM